SPYAGHTTRRVPPSAPPHPTPARVCRHPVSKSETACLIVRENEALCVTPEARWSPAALALYLLWSLTIKSMLNEYNELGIIFNAKPPEFFDHTGKRGQR